MKKRGFSLVELVCGIAFSVLIFQITYPVIRGSLKIFEQIQERSLGMKGKRIIETLTGYGASAVGGKIILINTTSTLSNRDIDLDRIRVQEGQGNGIYIEIPSLCSKNGVWTKVTEGHIFRFMETTAHGKHMRYIPINNLKGGKEDIISSDVLKGLFFEKEGKIYLYLKEKRGEAMEIIVGEDY